ncbi:MAG: class I SAM-dependent methyltransferase [Limnochordaceae bacterium]|nr:class I SAM-dependent methyltransferase [Limnochordaceae bacterium]
MTPEIQRRLKDLRAYFDQAASSWDASAHTDPAQVRSILAYARIEPGQCILDVGCGTGALIPPLLELTAPDGHVYALDLSPKMLEQCRRKYAFLCEPQSRLSFLLAPAEEIPLASDVCHGVVCYSSFPHFADKKSALEEVARVLRPGGWVLVAHGTSRAEVNRIHHQIGGPVAGDLLADAEDMAALLGAAGLVNPWVLDADDRYVALAWKEGTRAGKQVQQRNKAKLD